MTVVTASRKRFRRITAVAAAVGVVFFGLVPATAAYALGTVTARVVDTGGSPLTSQMVMEWPGGSTGPVYPNANGEISETLPPGDYTLRTWDPSRYPLWEHDFTVVDGETTALGEFTLDQFASVAGTVPIGLADDVGIHVYKWNGSYWYLYSSGWPYTPESDGSFRIWFADPSGTFTLEFVPDDAVPYITTYLGESPELPATLDDPDTYFTLGALNSIAGVGNTSLLAAGVISGTVVTETDADPIEYATVIADDLDGNQLAEAETDATGAFSLKVPLDVPLVLRSYASGWLHQYYDRMYDADDAEEITLTTADPARTDILFQLMPEIAAYFSVYADDGGGSESFRVNTWLYYNGGGGFSPIPFDIDWDDDEASFYELLPGTYRVGLQLVDESGWIPFSTANVIPGTIPGAGSACYFQFEVTGAIVEFEFELTAEPDSSACTEAPWLDGAGTPSDVHGVVTNIADVVGPATATLYIQDSWGDPIEVVSTTVDPATGAYTLAGVYIDGEYFVGIETAPDNPHLDMLFGDGEEQLLFHRYDYSIDGFLIDAQDDKEVDVTLPEARVLSGIITVGGVPVQDSCVLLLDFSYDSVDCGRTDSSGRYWVKAPVPDISDPNPLEYKIVAGTNYILPTFWGVDPASGDWIPVTESGLDPLSYDIELMSIPSFILGDVAVWDYDESDSVAVDGGTAHLYRKSGSTWVEIDAFPMVDDTWSSLFAFPGELLDIFAGGSPEDLFDLEGLAPGDYRIWFSQNGTWLPITEFERNVFSLAGFNDWQDFDGETCYLDVPAVGLSTLTIFYEVLLDPEVDLDCTPPTTSGGGPAPPAPPVKKPVASTGDNQQGDSPDDELTDESGSEGEGPGVIQPTAPPTPSPAPSADDGPETGGADLTWLWWVGGILLLIVIGGGVMLVLRRP